MICISFSSAKASSAACMAPDSASEVSTPITVTVVPARSAPSMPLSAAAAGAGSGPRLWRAAGRLGACWRTARGFGAGRLGARWLRCRRARCPLAAVSSGAVVSVPALATPAAPSAALAIASVRNTDRTRERERIGLPLRRGDPSRRFSPWFRAGGSGAATLPDPAAPGQAGVDRRARRHAASILRRAPGDRANG